MFQNYDKYVHSFFAKSFFKKKVPALIILHVYCLLNWVCIVTKL